MTTNTNEKLQYNEQDFKEMLTFLKKEVKDIDVNQNLQDLKKDIKDNAQKQKCDNILTYLSSKGFDIQNISVQDSLQIINGINICKQSMGNEFVDFLFGGEYKLKNGEKINLQGVSKEDIVSFFREVSELSFDKEKEITKTIIFTQDELKKIEKILHGGKTKEELKEFLNEQFKENITSKELVLGTELHSKISKFVGNKEDADKFFDNMDNMWYIYLKGQCENISEDSLRNMATGLNIAFLELSKNISSSKKEELFKSFANVKISSFEDVLTIFKNFFQNTENAGFVSKLQGFSQNINNLVSENNNLDTKNNGFLNNPFEIKDAFVKYNKGEIDKNGINNLLIDNAINKEISQQQLNQIKNVCTDASKSINKQSFKGFKGFSDIFKVVDDMKSSFKNQALVAGGAIIGFKEIFAGNEMMKPMRDGIKSMFDSLLKFIGFKGGFDEFEQTYNNKNGLSNNEYVDLENIDPKNVGKTIIGVNNLYISKGGKKMGELNFEEASTLAEKVFGAGPGTDLMKKLSKGSPVFITRLIALGVHEGGLKFQSTNDDPNKASQQNNIGTFQISAKGWEAVAKKYKNCLLKGKTMAEKESIKVDFDNLSEKVRAGQQDLLAHLGYIQDRSNSYKKDLFVELGDATLTNEQVVDLMSKKIQGGIPTIGERVVSQQNNLVNPEMISA